MKIGQIFRYSKPKNKFPEFIDGLPNFFFHTYTPNNKLVSLEKGIVGIAKIKAKDAARRPAILTSSSPHNIGSEVTPWQDYFDEDNGHIRYFGDNKDDSSPPEKKQGNAILLEQFTIHNSTDIQIRKDAVPIIFFQRVRYEGRSKGNPQFKGFGIISRVERVTQYNLALEQPFTNYVYDFTVLDLISENEEFDWKWISARREPNISLEETLKLAPSSWKNWINDGSLSVEKNKRKVSKLFITKTTEQQPQAGTTEKKVLDTIYNFYSESNARKKRFELLASVVAGEIIKDSIGNYTDGWITPSGSDGGADFIGRVDIGKGFGSTKLIVLGQAKCEKTNLPTGGNHIARTVARLKRGWIGVYVTTSYFSEPVQREIIDDKFPILLINGLRLSEEVIKLSYQNGHKNILDYIRIIDRQYESKIASRNPEEVLLF